MVEAAKRVKHHNTCKKKAITVEQVKKIYDHCFKTEPNLYNMRTLSFCGFLGCSDALKIRRSDIYFQPLSMKIFIEKSKADIEMVTGYIYGIVSSNDVTKIS